MFFLLPPFFRKTSIQRSCNFQHPFNFTLFNFFVNNSIAPPTFPVVRADIKVAGFQAKRFSRYTRSAGESRAGKSRGRTKKAEAPGKRGHAESILLPSAKTIAFFLAQRQRGHAESILCHSAICHDKTPALYFALLHSFFSHITVSADLTNASSF